MRRTRDRPNAKRPLLEPSVTQQSGSFGGIEYSLTKSFDKSTYHKMKSFDINDMNVTNPSKLEDEFEQSLSFISILSVLMFGIIIIILAFVFNKNNYFNIDIDKEYLIINTSYLLLLLSFGVSLISSAIWSISQQYYTLNGCMKCIKYTSGSNIFCIMFGTCLLILCIIALFQKYSDIYSSYNFIAYPLWLILTFFIVSLICFLFVLCINTTSAKRRRQKRNYLQNFYRDKMMKEEGNNSDFKRKEHRDKLPHFISKNTPLHPYDRSICALIWHTMTHYHIFALIHLGTKKTIETFDCYFHPKADDIEYNFNEWMKQSAKREAKYGKGNLSTWSILWSIEGKPFLILMCIMMISTLPGLAVPQIIGELATFYEDTSIDLSYGIYLSFGLLLIGIIRVELGAIVMTMASRVLGRVIGLISYVIYYKAVHMSNNTDDELSMGQKITMLATDSKMIAYLFAFQPMFIANFVLMAFVCVFLHIEIGISALAGWMFVLLVSLPIQVVVGNKVMSAWKTYIALSDKRVKFIDELIKGIKVTKMYAWERALMNQILGYRQEEMVSLLKRIKFISVMSMINGSTPAIMALIMFATYIALGNTLSLRVVFAVITLIQMLGATVRTLPYAVMLAVGGAVAIKRLNKFYNAPDQIDMIYGPNHKEKNDVNDYSRDQYVVYIRNASFQWPKVKKKEDDEKDTKQDETDNKTTEAEIVDPDEADDDTKSMLSAVSMISELLDTNQEVKQQQQDTDYDFLLDNVCMKLERGKLYALVGAVGSGKSSMIQAILREMKQVNGVLRVNGCDGNVEECVGYCAQTAFIVNDTVRENILFGLDYDERFYNKCLKASSLVHDLSILANGDLTEIGERGINLSGGQKQRISFCRALYRSRQTNLYLLDDPLSAVDTHVGNNMFHEGIKELLCDKTVLIVMNSHLHLLESMDEIIIMDKGTLVVQTTYDKVMENETYAHLLPHVDDEQTEEEVVENENEHKEEKETDYEHVQKISPKAKTSKAQNNYGAIEQASRDKKGKLTSKEDRKSGSVAFSTYVQYFNNAMNPFDHNEVINDEVPNKSHIGGLLLLVLEITLLLFNQVCATGSDIWLAFWAEEEQVNRFNSMPDEWWLAIWSMLIAALTIITFTSSYLFGYLSNKAAQSVHMKTLYCILRAPMSYFDQTPTGRILNRFSKDTNEMDTELPSAFVNFSLNFLTVVGYAVVIVVSIPYALLLLIILIPALYFLQRYFRMSSSDLKRLTQVTSTPIISQFSETLGGLDTIRAYHATECIFLKDFRRKLRVYHKVVLADTLTMRWFAQYLDMMIVFFLLFQTLLCCYLRDQFESAMLSLSVVYAFSMMGMLNWAIRSSVEVEKNFTTIERLLYFENALKKNVDKRNKENNQDEDEEEGMITSEAKEINFEYRKPKKLWPSEGTITIKHLRLRYRKDLDYVLNDLSVTINGGEKVGIVGRTGAGKSSLLLALFRLVEPTQDSWITIDDINCLKLGLKELRSSLSIIPQEPVLFSGSLKFNLDPFNEKTDDEIWDVLKKCELFEFVNSKAEKLLYTVAEGGNNFSAGQKQLICIARALLKRSKILALDEATSSIDKHTDSLIQTLIRKEFANVTVLCIAHRLDTIMDYDKIIVLAKGSVVEYDTPKNLLNNKSGKFYQMVNSLHSTMNLKEHCIK